MTKEQILEKVDKDYDFTNDCTSEKYKDINNDVIKKYFVYKAKSRDLKTFKLKNDGEYNGYKYKKGEIVYKDGYNFVKTIQNDIKYKGIIDPDSNSWLLQNIYMKLWLNIEKDEYMKANKYICGDTMNSFSYVLQVISGYTINKSFDEYEKGNIKDRLNSNDEINNELIRFLTNYHKLGNFIPVPNGFNVARSGYNAMDDNWFDTLYKIENYYTNKSNSKNVRDLVSLLHNNTFKNVIEWLDKYKNFNTFVKKNYLENYCNKKGDDYHTIILKWNCKSRDELTDNEKIEFLKNVNDAIEKRTNDMLKKLKSI